MSINFNTNNIYEKENYNNNYIPPHKRNITSVRFSKNIENNKSISTVQKIEKYVPSNPITSPILSSEKSLENQEQTSGLDLSSFPEEERNRLITSRIMKGTVYQLEKTLCYNAKFFNQIHWVACFVRLSGLDIKEKTKRRQIHELMINAAKKMLNFLQYSQPEMLRRS